MQSNNMNTQYFVDLKVSISNLYFKYLSNQYKSLLGNVINQKWADMYQLNIYNNFLLIEKLR